MKKCLICEKYLPPIDDKMPNNIEGGTLDIDFGYGSDHDTGSGWSGNNFVFSAAICDKCFEKKKNLGQWTCITQAWVRTDSSEEDIYGKEEGEQEDE